MQLLADNRPINSIGLHCLRISSDHFELISNDQSSALYIYLPPPPIFRHSYLTHTAVENPTMTRKLTTDYAEGKISYVKTESDNHGRKIVGTGEEN